jgi:glucosylceramidase
LLLDETGNPNIGPFSCGGLATLNSVSGEISFSGQYKAFSYIAKHINNQSKIYSLITNEVEKNSMFAFPQNQGLVDGFVVENEKDTVIVLINGENAKKQVQVNIDDTLYYVELAPDSLSKVII